MSWFTRHINLSLTIWWIGGLAIVLMLIPVGGESFYWALLSYLVILFIIDGWALQQKGRSLSNLLYILLAIAIGQIIFLCMVNKKRLIIKGSLPSFSVSTTVG